MQTLWDLFGQEASIGSEAPNARASDPQSSHEANAKIRANRGLAGMVLKAVQTIQDASGATDDAILEWIEASSGKRQQRNVIARTRGLLERDGFLVRVSESPRVAVIVAEGLTT